MKKVLVLLALMTVAFTVSAQNSQKPKQIVVNVNDLTQDQLAKVQARNKVEQVTGQIETYSKYAGMGKEVGIAVSEGLGAVKDVTLEFADSNVGKLTMALIVWKVIGDDLKGMVLGIPIWLLVTFLFIWSYRRSLIRRKKLIKKDGGWWIFGGVKQYEMVSPIYTDEVWGVAIVHAAVYALFTGVMFGAVIF